MSLNRFLFKLDQVVPFFLTKNVYHTISILWKRYDNDFFDKQNFTRDTKNFPINFESLHQKFFLFFFQPQIEFSTQTNIS